MRFIATAVAALLPAALVAQTVNLNAAERAELQNIVHTEGHRCDAVPSVRVAGKLDTGDIMLVVSCTGGAEHVIRYSPTAKTYRYYMECGRFLNPVKC